jgi:succinate-semialdehyde dehydrogenase/glutarate-semialdehyde dehydrogenase
MITRKAGPALAAGCTMVLEPATATRSRHWPSAPAPEGRLFFCHGPSSEIGGEMTSNPIVRKLTFTGLTEVGKLLMEQCAGTVKKLPSELGGNAPLIVFDDADIEIAVKGAIASKSECRPDLRQGQPDFLVQVGVYDAHQPKPPVR